MNVCTKYHDNSFKSCQVTLPKTLAAPAGGVKRKVS